MKRWPTEPVAPSTPTIESVHIQDAEDDRRTALLLREVRIMGCKMFGIHGYCMFRSFKSIDTF
jgi:hypothetical protein